MKKLFTLLIIMLCTVAAFAQSCCTKEGATWKELAMNVDFKNAHLPPLPLNYTPPAGSMMSFETLDGKPGNAFYLPSDEATNKVLIIFHEWWGLNDYIKREAVNWQNLLGNVDVYAIDLYDGKVATDPDVASALMSGLDPKRAETIIKGLLSKIGPNKQIVTLGWCMGGSWSFTASVLAGQQATGCVMYYGFPEKDDKRTAAIKTDVVYVYGTQDKFIKQFMVDQFGEKIKATGHKFSLYSYDAPHAFANPSNPAYNSLFATQAQNITLKFFKDKLELN